MKAISFVAAAALALGGAFPLAVGAAAPAGTLAGSGLPAVVPQPVSEAAGSGGAFSFDANTSVTVTTSATDVAGVASYLTALARP